MSIHIKGWLYQHNMSQFLAQAENKYSQREFCAFLCKAQECDPSGFCIRSMESKGEKFTFVVSRHALARGVHRSCWTYGRVKDFSAKLLQDDLICTTVRDNMVVWNTEKNRVEAADGEISATLVVDQRTRTCWVYEAGFAYVRLVTMLDLCGDNDRYRVKPFTKVIRLNSDGSVECDVSKIREVIPFNMNRKAYPNKYNTRVLRA